jgi:hypothetical protein
MQTYNPLPKLKRQSDAILRKARKDFCGGLAYGLDLPTWQSVSPLSCAAWLAVWHSGFDRFSVTVFSRRNVS